MAFKKWLSVEDAKFHLRQFNRIGPVKYKSLLWFVDGEDNKIIGFEIDDGIKILPNANFRLINGRDKQLYIITEETAVSGGLEILQGRKVKCII